MRQCLKENIRGNTYFLFKAIVSTLDNYKSSYYPFKVVAFATDRIVRTTVQTALYRFIETKSVLVAGIKLETFT